MLWTVLPPEPPEIITNGCFTVYIGPAQLKTVKSAFSIWLFRGPHDDTVIY